jgi:hypothetical protein
MSSNVNECKPLPGTGSTRSLLLFRGVAAQVEFESKLETKLKPVYHILVSSAEFQAGSTWV